MSLALPVQPAHELDARPDTPRWLIEGLWADEAVGIVGGEPKSCKSFLVLDQRELKRLTDSGILRRFEKGRHIFFQADETCPIYAELRSLVTKSFGVIDVLRKALADLSPKIALAFVYGSVARGEERRGSDVDVFVIGDSSFREVAGAVTEAQASLGREINVTVYPEEELVEKVSKGHHFLSSVLNREKKLFIIGNEHELDALLDQQVDTRARDLEGGSLGSARDR